MNSWENSQQLMFIIRFIKNYPGSCKNFIYANPWSYIKTSIFIC